jgi:hypothetical protein
MCTCATHCTLSAYHDSACCNLPVCNCWCHGEIKLYLDATRDTPEGWFRTYRVEDAITWLRSRRVTHLSLDNDLREVLDWLEKTICNDKTFPLPEITIHASKASR